jgi:hypothetical protein
MVKRSVKWSKRQKVKRSKGQKVRETVKRSNGQKVKRSSILAQLCRVTSGTKLKLTLLLA